MRLTSLNKLFELSMVGARILAKSMWRTNVERLLINPNSLSLIVSSLNTVSGLYTFKAVILEEPVECKDIGLSNDPEICKREAENLCNQLRGTLNETNIDGFNEKVAELLKGVRGDIAEALYHELLHAYIMKETFALYLAERHGWRIRFTTMYFMENLYRTVGKRLSSGVERYGFKMHPEFRNISGFKGLEEGDARKVLREIQPRLKDLVANTRNTSILHDSYIHNIQLRYIIQPMVAPIVEVTTWYVMDQDIEEAIDSYISKRIFDENIHGLVLNKLVETIGRRKPEKQLIVKSANIALDFTKEEYERFIDGLNSFKKYAAGGGDITLKKVFANEINNIVFRRFVDVLDGKEVPRAPRHLKTLGNIFLYAFPSDIASDASLIFIKILMEEGLLSRDTIPKIVNAIGQHVGGYTAVYINIKFNGSYETVGSNPLTPFFNHRVKRTNCTLTTTELLVGDLVLAFKSFLSLGCMFSVFKQNNSQRGTLDDLIHELKDNQPMGKVLEVIAKAPSVYEEIVNRRESFIKLLESPDPKHTYNVVESFIYAVLLLGDRIRVLEGPHGLWYL